MMYLGMNAQTGGALTDVEHIRQSVRDILVTPVGSRLARREYGSLMADLIDEGQNEVTKLRVMAATYSALSRWEPRIRLTGVTIETSMDGKMTVNLTGYRTDGSPLTFPVNMGTAA